MNSTPPFVGQERSDSCAIACLRMILAYQGKHVSERDAIEVADMEEGGLTPDEVSRVAQHYGLRAGEQQLDGHALAELARREQFPIVFLFRRPLDGADMTHAVIPLRFSRNYATMLDPLRGNVA